MTRPKLTTQRPSKPEPKLSTQRPTTAAARGALAVSTEESRLAINLPMATHRDLKAKAAQAGVSIKDYVIDLLRKAGVAVP
jgi:predicted HicB family RNase H-like nuclease